MAEESENKAPKKEKSLEEARHKEAIKDIIRRYPSILQITSISFKETDSHIRQVFTTHS